MSDPEDISQYPDDRSGWGSDFGFSNGRVGGTTVPVGGNADTSLTFLYRGFHGVVNTGRTGWRFPIDPNAYRKLSFKMSQSVSQFPYVYWFHQRHGDPAPGGISGNGDGVTGLPASNSGDTIYAADLVQAPVGGEAWNAAPVLGVRIDPNSTVTGQQAFFDWVRLTRGDADPLAARHTIQWSGGSGTTTIQVIDASGTVMTVASGLSSSTTQYVWNYGVLPPGPYTLRVTRGGSSVNRSFSVNAPPVVHVTNPDETGGADFATTVLGNPWDMNDAADVEAPSNLTTWSFSGGQFHGTSNATGDPSVTFLNGYANPRPIDTARYRHLTFQLQVDGAFDLGAGSVARVFWGSDRLAIHQQTTSADIIIWPGLNSYTVDLPALTVGDGIVPGAIQVPWTSANVLHFRIDPHEFAASRSFHFADVKLAAIDETSGGVFAITFSGSDADGGDSPAVSLYYDTDTNASNGRTLIAGGLAMSPGAYSWNTSSVPAGTYYVYAEATDGINTSGSYSTGPLRVTGAGATLTVAVSGGGSVVSSPVGISCGTDCREEFGGGTRVTLIPQAAGGGVFAGWAGSADCFDSVVTMTGATACTANFVAALGTGPTRGAIDLNGDSGADSFRYGVQSGLWAMDFSNRAGGFNTRMGIWSAGWTVRAGDMDGNGLTDFFLYNPATGAWAKAINNNAADFTYFSSTWSAGWTPYVADLNADGRSDVFIYDRTTGAWFKCVSMDDGTGEFAYQAGHWSAGWDIYPADFNGDRAADLLLYNRATGQWFRATNDLGSGFAYDTGTWSADWNISPADLNGDRRSDVLLYNSSSGQWFAAMNTGGGFSYTTGVWSGGWTVGTGDFNNDGRADVFLYSTAGGQWIEAFSDGAGNFTYAGGTWSDGWQVYVTDFNADRFADILLYSPVTGTFFQATNAGRGAFTYGSGHWGLDWTIVPTRAAIP